MKILFAAALDLILLTAFAVLGRTSHNLALDISGIFDTAWPFIVGAAVGWLIMRAWRNPFGFGNAFPIWVATIVIGMLLRFISGQGIALPFIFVATGTTLLLLVGWRLFALIFRKFRKDSGLITE